VYIHVVLAHRSQSIDRERNRSLYRYVAYPSVSLSVRKVYFGKTADWIQMLFGVVSGVGQRMGVLDGGGDRRREWALFGGKNWASHCNRWGPCCVVV